MGLPIDLCSIGLCLKISGKAQIAQRPHKTHGLIIQRMRLIGFQGASIGEFAIYNHIDFVRPGILPTVQRHLQSGSRRNLLQSLQAGPNGFNILRTPGPEQNDVAYHNRFLTMPFCLIAAILVIHRLQPSYLAMTDRAM